MILNKKVLSVSFTNFKHTLFLIFCFVLLSTSIQAQKKYKTLVEDGDKSFSERDFFSASIYYSNAFLMDSADIALMYKYAEASRLNYDFDEAERLYNKVYKIDRQGKQFPDCTFWIATLQKNKGKYKDAQKLFKAYAVKNKRKNNDYLVKKANQEAAACDYAMLMVASPDTSVHVVHLDSNVNSKVSEYAPIQVDSLLYFSSLRDGKNKDKKNNVNFNKLYTAIQKDSVKWLKATELDTLFNKNKIHNANTSFNKDFTRVYITRCESKTAQDYVCEILTSEFKNGHWAPLVKLPAPINLPGATNTQPAIGFLDDEEVLFFSSDRPGGEGAMDIWYSKVNKDGTYGAPVNAGKKVNTLDDDITPFYCNSCKELYFSSTWHKGLGGFDIFKSEYKEKAFGDAKNLGVPVNSNYNDIYFTINSKQTAAFISSNRKGSFFEEKESCCNDIWKFDIPKAEEPPVKDSVPVFITQLRQLVPLTLYFHNDEPDRKTLAITTKKTYKQAYDAYSALRDQYKKEYSKGATGTDVERAHNDIDALFEDSVDAGMQDLQKFAELLVKVLKNNERVTITMKGYCSPLASTDYNVNLAKRRISSLRNYFMEYENGIIASYVNNTNQSKGSVTFTDEEIGELKARSNVSDDYFDIKNSIYNPVAAFERKIQIIAFSSTTAVKEEATNVIEMQSEPVVTPPVEGKPIEEKAPEQKTPEQK